MVNFPSSLSVGTDDDAFIAAKCHVRFNFCMVSGWLRCKPKPVKKVLDYEDLQEVKEAFRLFNTDSRGTIDMRELKAALWALGIQVKKARINQMVIDIGKDESETIYYNEFIELMTGETLTDEEMHEMTDEADRDEDGLNNEEEFFSRYEKCSEHLLDDPSDDD
ncbi:caltractin [Plasmopara halstedii]|uniref:Caltractin n=1 Tax=Plasmopara halstedii TaxID=4781 RepID=A0A0P1AG25_PLAHL|nr:caltractin [Plasmopara halstedii]CEG39701.1 caltractin [Plasmopara halstedii]|eukprot:XP_024576070.1 caltractin [Plasmopara halstedii]